MRKNGSGSGEWYIIVVYDIDALWRTLRTLRRHGDIKAVAILAWIENKAGIRGLRNISRSTVVMKGFLPLPRA